jgi:hypothetical protein
MEIFETLRPRGNGVMELGNVHLKENVTLTPIPHLFVGHVYLSDHKAINASLRLCAWHIS